MYVVGYSIGRFWVEGLRIDPAHNIAGLRLNQWVALIVGVLAVVYLVVDWSRHRDDVEPDLVAPEEVAPEEVAPEELSSAEVESAADEPGPEADEPDLPELLD